MNRASADSLVCCIAGCQPATFRIPRRSHAWRRSADWQSAIRQVGNLRYFARCAPTGSWSPCVRECEWRLSMNRPIVGRASRQSLEFGQFFRIGWLSAWTCCVAAIRFGALVLMLCTPLLPAAEAPSPIQFKDVTRQTGIPFVHTDGSSGRRYIVENVCSGLATFDYNGDGKIDILFLNGAPLPGSPTATPLPRNALYRNDGGWKFTDVTLAAGLGDTNYHLGVCVGDYNNDGYPDIYLNNFGPSILYRNNGNGTFTDVTQAA